MKPLIINTRRQGWRNFLPTQYAVFRRDLFERAGEITQIRIFRYFFFEVCCQWHTPASL